MIIDDVKLSMIVNSHNYRYFSASLGATTALVDLAERGRTNLRLCDAVLSAMMKRATYDVAGYKS